MAAQLAVAVLVAFAVAELVDRTHLVWTVLTVLIIHSGNRGRGDVLWKGAQRVVGALAGTTIATLIAGAFAPGDPAAIVVIFAILAVASAVRDLGYAWWAAGITSALALLYGYFGETGTGLLLHRLGGIAVGCVIGIGAAWFVWPVRTTDVVRLRLAGVRDAARDVATAIARGETDLAAARSRLAAADAELARFDQITAAGRRLGIGDVRGLHDAVQRAHGLAARLL